MKYCQNCGCELGDTNVFCTRCGSRVAPMTPPAPAPAPAVAQVVVPQTYTVPVVPAPSVEPKKENKPNGGLLTVNFIYWIFAILCVFSFVLSVINAGISTSIYTSSYYSSGNTAYSWFSLDEDSLVLGVLCSIGMIPLSIVSCVLTGVGGLDRERKFSAILKMILATLTFILLICAIAY